MWCSIRVSVVAAVCQPAGHVSQRAVGASVLLRRSAWVGSCCPPHFSGFRGCRTYREDGCELPANSVAQKRGVNKKYIQKATASETTSVPILLFAWCPWGPMILKALIKMSSSTEDRRVGKSSFLALSTWSYFLGFWDFEGTRGTVSTSQGNLSVE